MRSFLAQSLFPLEVEILSAVCFVGVVAAAVRAHRLIRRQGPEPTARETLALAFWIDAPRYLGAICLLLATFGFALGIDESMLARTFAAPTDEVYLALCRRPFRLLGAGALCCGLGFAWSWFLGWYARERRARRAGR